MGELLFARVARDECEASRDGVRVGSLTVSQKSGPETSEVLANNEGENGVFIDPTETSTYTAESLK